MNSQQKAFCLYYAKFVKQELAKGNDDPRVLYRALRAARYGDASDTSEHKRRAVEKQGTRFIQNMEIRIYLESLGIIQRGGHWKYDPERDTTKAKAKGPPD